MNPKLLSGFAIAALLMGVGSQTFAHAAFADTLTNPQKAKSIAIGQAAGQEQLRILKEMQENSKPRSVDLPGLIHK